MFEFSPLRLSDFMLAGLTVVRDGNFLAVGKIPTRLQGRLVPVGNRKALVEFEKTQEGVAGVICREEDLGHMPAAMPCAISDNPLKHSLQIHAQLVREGRFWRSFESRIDPSAQIHPRAYVASRDVVIGPGVVVEPHAVINERTVIGAGSYIGAGTIVASQAYEIGTLEQRPVLLPQAGGVKIGRNVTLLSNVTVARSIFPLFTEIGDDSSCDNIVHVAHDCVLGEGVKMAAGAVLCGRVTIGDRAYIAPNATISNGLTLGEDSFVSLGSVVVKNVLPGGRVTGAFAKDHMAAMRAFRKSP